MGAFYALVLMIGIITVVLTKTTPVKLQGGCLWRLLSEADQSMLGSSGASKPFLTIASLREHGMGKTQGRWYT